MNVINVKKINNTKSVLIISAILSVIIMTVLPVFGGAASALYKIAKGWLEDIIVGTIDGDTLSVFETVLFNSANPASSAYSVANQICINVVKPAALSLVGLCFTIKIAQVATQLDRITPERLFTPFLQLMGCSFIVGESEDIMHLFIRVGHSFTVDMHNKALSLLTSDYNSLANQLIPDLTANQKWWDVLGLKGIWGAVSLCAQLLLPHLVYWILSLLIKAVCYGVIIEILVRAAMLPLFGGDLMLHGFESRGIHFLKGFLAACCQGAMIVLVLSITNALCVGALNQIISETGGGSALTDIAVTVKGIGKVLVFNFAGFSMMLKSSQIMREAFGA